MNIAALIFSWYHCFTGIPAEPRVLRHIANIDKDSARKRINMFVRWMVRNDQKGIDFGLWKNYINNNYSTH